MKATFAHEKQDPARRQVGSMAGHLPLPLPHVERGVKDAGGTTWWIATRVGSPGG